jgi:hypothetical protein
MSFHRLLRCISTSLSILDLNVVLLSALIISLYNHKLSIWTTTNMRVCLSVLC